eukprot:COSAG05_NODE_17297_length_328_cov_0.668122_2_plen_36_part_01
MIQAIDRYDEDNDGTASDISPAAPAPAALSPNACHS